MEKSKLVLRSLANALGTAVYTAAMAWFLFNGQQIFGMAKSFWAPFALLLLFVISAAAVSTLMLGKPILLYLEGKKRDSVDMFLCSLTWLAVIGILMFLIRPW